MPRGGVRPLALLLALGTSIPLAAQSARVKVLTCSEADSVLGPASHNVMRSELHGALGPGSAYQLTSGALFTTQSPPPGHLMLMNFPSPNETLAAQYVMAFFRSSVLEAAKSQAEPMYLVLDKKDTIPLSTPEPPAISGSRPRYLPLNAVMRPEDLDRLFAAKDVRFRFLGETARLDDRTRDEFEAAYRTQICWTAQRDST